MRRIISSYAPLLLVTAGQSAFEVGYVLTETPKSALAMLVSALGLPLFAALWALADARRRRRRLCYDFGLFFVLAWPASLVWYCLTTRRGRGILVLLMLAAVFLVGTILTAILVHVLSDYDMLAP